MERQKGRVLTLMFAIVMLAACGSEDDVRPAVTDQGIEDGIDVAEIGLEPAGKLENCYLLDEDAQDSFGRGDCFLKSPDDTGITFDLDYSGVSDGDGTLVITIRNSDGAIKQVMQEDVEGGFGFPTVVDLNLDGVAEIGVPLYTGNVNTTYSLYHAVSADAAYEPVGYVSGVDLSPRDDGSFSVSARANAASWVTETYAIREGALDLLYLIELTLSDDGPEICNVRDSGGLSSVGMSLEQAQQEFCTESDPAD